VKAAYAQKLQSKETEFNGKINSLENEKSLLTEKLENLEKQISTSSGENHEAIESLKSEYEAKLRTLEAAKSEALQEAEERIMKLEKSLGEAGTVIAETKAQLKESESNITQEVEKVRHQCTSQFEAMLKEKSDALADLSHKLEAASTAEGEATQQVEKLSETLQKTQSELKQYLETTSDGARKQLEDLEKKLKEDHDLYVETLKADHEKALRDIDEERQKDRDNLNQLAAATLEKEKGLLSEELGLKIRQLSEEKEELRSAMEKHVDQLTSQFKAKLDELRKSHTSEISQFQDTIKEKEIKCTEAVDQLKKLTAGTALLRSEHEKLKKQLSVALESTKGLSIDLEKARNEKEDAIASTSKKESSMLEMQESLTREKNEFLEKIQNLESEVKSKANTTEELQGKLSALSDNLNSIVEERNNLAEKLARAEKQESKLKSSEGEVSELREQVNMLKLESTKNRNLVQRLQSEKEASERSHGQRTALVGLLEKQLADATDNNSELNAKLEAIRYDMSQTIQQYMENIRNLQLQLEEAEKKSKVAAEALAAVPKGPDAKTKNLVESLQKELQNVRQQMAKKSTAAQKLIQEKELECIELRKANSALQQEVDQGSLSDRRILELAAKQSNRESQQLAQITARDKTIESMMEKVVERDNQLAFMENKVHEVEQQIEELRRVRRREDVNLDYLKTTVVKYLSLPPGSSERAGLLPVLATLLQFDQNDYKVIEDGKSKMSWWGSIAPTLISAPESVPIPRPSTTSSAEVSVNRQNGEGSSRGTTSLQF
jgi:chromosome segregation ATPase